MCNSDYDWVFSTAMRVNMIDEDSQVKVLVTLPGAKKEDIRIAVKDEFLNVRLEKAQDAGTEAEYLWREFLENGYERDILVGGHMKKDKISASYDNGILTILVPKEEPQTVPVQ